ncbi:MAG: hypothetical protein WCG00_14450 [Hyphomicrobiales bacterium]
MNKFVKFAVAATMTGAFALALASPSEARNGRNAAAIGGFAAGAVLGAAIANSNNGYYGGPGYYYQEPVYAPGYAYEPAPVYVSPRRGYRGGGCWIATDTSRGYGYYGAC